MNKDQIKGKAQNIKGKVEQAVGSFTDDKKAEGGGIVDRVAGAAREKVGDAKEALNRERDRQNKDEDDIE